MARKKKKSNLAELRFKFQTWKKYRRLTMHQHRFIPWKKYKKLTEQQQTNWFLFNNINARKTHSELDLINLSLFTGRTFSAEYKEKKYTKGEWRSRAWWNQELIFFDKPGWWNAITGWEKVGLMHVIEKKGPFFFDWKYKTKAGTFKLMYIQRLLVTNLHTRFISYKGIK